MSVSRTAGAHDAFRRISSLSIEDGEGGDELFVSTHRGQDLYDALLDEYVRGLPEIFLALRKDLQAHNWQAGRFKCHQLKGSLGTYGYPGLSRLFAWIDEWLSVVEKAPAFPDFGAQLSRIESLVTSLTAQSAFHAAASRRRASDSSPHWAMGV